MADFKFGFTRDFGESKLIKDLGADSLDLVEMLLQLEETFGVTISDEQTENIKTVQDIVDLIDA